MLAVLLAPPLRVRAPSLDCHLRPHPCLPPRDHRAAAQSENARLTTDQARVVLVLHTLSSPLSSACSLRRTRASAALEAARSHTRTQTADETTTAAAGTAVRKPTSQKRSEDREIGEKGLLSEVKVLGREERSGATDSKGANTPSDPAAGGSHQTSPHFWQHQIGPERDGA